MRLYISALFLCACTLSLAQTSIPMYASPNHGAKRLSTLTVKKTLTIVHHPWVQVYDAATKQTGWVKEKDLAAFLKQPIRIDRTIVSQQTHPMQVIEYHASNVAMDPKVIANIIERNQRIQQQVIQEMSDSFRSMEEMSQLIWQHQQPKLSIKIIDEPSTASTKKGQS